MAADEPKREPTLCHGLVEAIATSLRAQAEAKGVKLVVAKNSEDIVARTDRKTLGILVMGMMGCAIENTPRGVVHVRVLRSGAGAERAVEFSITEVAAEGEAAAASRTQASALLLSRSQALAAAMGGKISIHFNAGEGSTYVLQIPEG